MPLPSSISIVDARGISTSCPGSSPSWQPLSDSMTPSPRGLGFVLPAAQDRAASPASLNRLSIIGTSAATSSHDQRSSTPDLPSLVRPSARARHGSSSSLPGFTVPHPSPQSSPRPQMQSRYSGAGSLGGLSADSSSQRAKSRGRKRDADLGKRSVLTEEQARQRLQRREMRGKIIAEILSTERVYVAGLNLIEQVRLLSIAYLMPQLTRLCSPAFPFTAAGLAASNLVTSTST